jgi:hypothetical protein
MSKEWQWWNNLSHKKQRELVYKYYTGGVYQIDTAEVENMYYSEKK